MRRHALVFACFVIAGLAAGAAVAQEAEMGADGMPDPREAVFCKETYALCITAQCQEVESPDGERRMAECVCDVIENTDKNPAWSMGPSSCEDRLPREVDGRTVLVSTYSNLYNNDTNQVATCDRIDWAWCYGAECAVDENDPSKAVCNCPITTSKTNILGPCDQDLCENGLWSAAWPQADCFANCRFYNQMTKRGRETNPPATACTTGEPLCECPAPSE